MRSLFIKSVFVLAALLAAGSLAAEVLQSTPIVVAPKKKIKKKIKASPSTIEVEIFYPGNSSYPLPAEMAKFNALPLNSNMTVTVEGFADNVGGSYGNKVLTDKRVARIAALLKQKFPGINVQTISHGLENPKYDNSTEAGRIKNRRVVIRYPSGG